MNEPPDLSGKDVIKVLAKFNYTKGRQKGSHVVLKYRHPNTKEIRTVTVPLHDSLKTGTLRSIAKQAGADDFHEFIDWINRNR